MIFPIGDDQVQGGARPIFSYAFIALNIAVFVMLQLGSDSFTRGYSTVPYEISHNVDLVEDVELTEMQAIVPHAPGPYPIYLALITSMFMHGGWMHLIGNMVFLWVFADNIESTIGSKRFILFYLLGGIAASLTHIATDMNSIIPSLGASGAIAACLGAYLVMFPRSKVKMLFFITIFSIPAFAFLGFWIIQQLIPGFQALNGAEGGGVAWWAHIGGFAFGVLAGFYFRSGNPGVVYEFGSYHPKTEENGYFNNRAITERFERK